MTRTKVLPFNQMSSTGLRYGANRYSRSSTGCPGSKSGWVDGGYRGEALQDGLRRLKRTHKIALEVVKKQPPGFTILKRRWVIERTFAWLFNYRIHAQDYEVLTANSEAFIYIAMIHLILRRLA